MLQIVGLSGLTFFEQFEALGFRALEFYCVGLLRVFRVSGVLGLGVEINLKTPKPSSPKPRNHLNLKP